MFRKVSRLALMVCALGSGLVVATPADADGWWGKGSIKDRAAVPVPAPMPIPDYAARWYLRADLGLGFVSPDPSEKGIIYGDNFYGPDPVTSTPIATPGHWSVTDTDTTLSYGAGLGYYWSPIFRTDITLEGRTERKLNIRGTYRYDPDLDDELYDDPNDDTEYRIAGETRDQGKLNSGLFLVNAYLDFTRSGPLTPYIGAGVGFAMNKLERTYSNTEYTYADGDEYSGPRNAAARDSTYDVTFAAAVMAGLSYSITPVTMLDLNYRYLYIGSSDINLNINGVKSNFSTGDTHEHQVRLGLRWNIQ
jgi:opacity protein-like surface antigen